MIRSSTMVKVSRASGLHRGEDGVDKAVGLLLVRADGATVHRMSPWWKGKDEEQRFADRVPRYDSRSDGYSRSESFSSESTTGAPAQAQARPVTRPSPGRWQPGDTYGTLSRIPRYSAAKITTMKS